MSPSLYFDKAIILHPMLQLHRNSLFLSVSLLLLPKKFLRVSRKLSLFTCNIITSNINIHNYEKIIFIFSNSNLTFYLSNKKVFKLILYGIKTYSIEKSNQYI